MNALNLLMVFLVLFMVAESFYNLFLVIESRLYANHMIPAVSAIETVVIERAYD